MSHVETPPDRSARIIPFIRKTFSDSIVISTDSNGSFGVDEAMRIGKIIQDYNYAFYEEPVPFDDYDGLRQVADALNIPIAVGEQEPPLITSATSSPTTPPAACGRTCFMGALY